MPEALNRIARALGTRMELLQSHDALEAIRFNAEANRDKEPDLAMLLGEISELAYAIVGRHEHSIELELIQIGGICVNWLQQLTQLGVDK